MKKAFLTLSALILALSLNAQTLLKYEVPFPRPIRNTPDTISVVIIGDVMMHTKQLPHDYSVFLKDISAEMKGADIAVANMEFPLGGKPYMGYPVFSTPDEFPWILCEQCGIDLMLMGNNHVLDKGETGLERTFDIYDKIRDSLGVSFTGCARNARELEESYPAVISRKGVKIAFINFTYGTNIGPSKEWPKACRMKKDEISAAFKRAKAKGADFIVAIPHWGVEYELKHSTSQKQWAEWLVDQGADAIVGSHPHVVQDTTHIKGVPVIYSLGNAVSNMSIINSRLELAAILRFTRDQATGEMQMLEPELQFMWCTLPGRLTEGYATVSVKKWASRRSDWLIDSDYLNMMETLARVKASTGIQ